MQLLSSIEKKRYLQGLRSQMDSLFAFGQQRFTGLVLGNFIYITSHAGYEWNRRISNEKSRAIGFVHQRGDGCVINVATVRGYLDPVSLILWYLFGLCFFVLKGGFPIPAFWHWISAGIALAIGLVSAMQCCLTYNGEQSKADLMTLLENPIPLWEEE